MAKILLMDLDIIKKRHPFPNLALMKLSAYHKGKGDEVMLNFPLCQPDISYASCVFTWNTKRKNGLSPDTILGGSGIDLKAELPPEVEHSMPDYNLYPDIDFSMGFTSRGCIRKCPFCIVPDKEGSIKACARISEFWDRRHKKIVLLDNNLLASPNWRQTMEDLIAEGLLVDFNQGLDIRLVNEEKAGYLKRVKAKQLRFAFDNIAYKEAVERGIRTLVEAGIPLRKLSFYVLVAFDGDNTAIERMRFLASYGVDVFPMIYKSNDGKEPQCSEKWDGTIFWHGARQNLRKFLRVMGRLK